jgi:hypothetical protein
LFSGSSPQATKKEDSARLIIVRCRPDTRFPVAIRIASVLQEGRSMPLPAANYC